MFGLFLFYIFLGRLRARRKSHSFFFLMLVQRFICRLSAKYNDVNQLTMSQYDQQHTQFRQPPYVWQIVNSLNN